jgi:hypothetical protein
MARWLIVLAISSAACAGPAPVDSVTPTAALPSARVTHTQSSSPQRTPAIEHPTGATDVVLRMWRSGGFLYPGTTIDEPPTFTLYGDGRVIYAVRGPGDGSRWVLGQAQLTEEQVGAVIENALGPGGLALARNRYDDVPMADGTTTNFEIDAGGVSKTVAVYALGEYDDPVADADERAAFESLSAELRGFASQVSAGAAIDLGQFEPESYRVSLFPDLHGELASTAQWPWSDLAPDDFERDNSGFGHLVVSAAQGEVVADLPIGELGDPVVAGPDGIGYLLRARPLLPDEVP